MHLTSSICLCSPHCCPLVSGSNIFGLQGPSVHKMLLCLMRVMKLLHWFFTFSLLFTRALRHWRAICEWKVGVKENCMLAKKRGSVLANLLGEKSVWRLPRQSLKFACENNLACFDETNNLWKLLALYPAFFGWKYLNFSAGFFSHKCLKYKMFCQISILSRQIEMAQI